ncbi:glutamyl-queuosine tRNA(Asp) synthetase [Burkholderiales bacterium JOSHI_001]|nr:glutamyl-queuosine tRNA(Asp) synthetase [Burkholderiales bacterium JOSHI_001]
MVSTASARPFGRFAPSPTGPLHAGSLVAALASWLDARAQSGRWVVRIEDVDGPRCSQAAEETILRQLLDCGLITDEPPLRQSGRGSAYQAALDRLVGDGWAYPCGCSRREVEDTLVALGMLPQRHEERVYPGTCRGGLHGKPGRAWRVWTERPPAQAAAQPGGEREIDVLWRDRRLGFQQQNLTREVGDFVLKRADGLWAYQLAVVVDDAHQGVTDVVRGEDMADNTARQIHLQRLLGLPTPRYLHTPLVLAADGQKLSKQTGALALATREPLPALRQAAAVLGLPELQAPTLAEWLAKAIGAWSQRWPQRPGAADGMMRGPGPAPGQKTRPSIEMKDLA